MKKIIFCLVVMCGSAGCGIKGDPLPPAEEETVQKQSVDSATPAPKQESLPAQPAKEAKKKTK